VNHLKEFIIQFSGLELGIHNFEFNVDDNFFKEFEYSEITKGKVKVNLQLEKQVNMLNLEFLIDGYVTCVCDRCLENYQQKITANERVLVKFGDDKSEESDEIVVIPTSQIQIDISQDVFEFIILSLPIKRVHPEDKNGKSDCNKDIIKILNKLDVHENNDPRWDELKKLSFKN
jgi:uncharacterized protein